MPAELEENNAHLPIYIIMITKTIKHKPTSVQKTNKISKGVSIKKIYFGQNLRKKRKTLLFFLRRRGSTLPNVKKYEAK